MSSTIYLLVETTHHHSGSACCGGTANQRSLTEKTTAYVSKTTVNDAADGLLYRTFTHHIDERLFYDDAASRDGTGGRYADEQRKKYRRDYVEAHREIRDFNESVDRGGIIDCDGLLQGSVDMCDVYGARLVVKVQAVRLKDGTAVVGPIDDMIVV